MCEVRDLDELVADLDAEPAAEDLAVLLSIVAPARATPHGKSVIEWTVRRRSSAGTAAVRK